MEEIKKMSIDYYEAPTQEIFDDIKKNAIKIWQTYDDEKVGRIKDIKNVSDNAWYIVAMFDYSNQAKLINMVKKETKEILLKVLTNLTGEQDL